MQKGSGVSDRDHNIAVFIRATNDMDHIVPVVHEFMARYPGSKIKTVIADYAADHFDDFRIAHLKNLGAEIMHAADYLEMNPALRKVYFMLAGSPVWAIGLAARKLFSRFYADKKIGKSWLTEKFFSDPRFQNLDAIFYDHNPGIYASITREAQKRGIATIALPHAADNFENYMIADYHLDPYKRLPLDTPYLCDRVIAASAHMKDHLLECKVVTEAQVRVLGSARFCRKWQEFLPSIAPKGEILPSAPGKFKIVFMLPKCDKNSFVPEILRMIKVLSRIKDVEIIAKLHTRLEKFPRFKAQNVRFCAGELESKTLIDWADLTLFTATSVVVDNIRQDKPVLHLRRTFGNKIIFERYIKSWAIDTRDELCAAVMRLQSGEQARTYTTEERKNFLSALIEPSGEGVLGLYVSEIMAAIEEKRARIPQEKNAA